jgi:hypothetical protein
MKEGKFRKLNISLPPDLHEWIKKKQADFKRENPLGKLDISPFVAHCIKAMKDSEESSQKSSIKPSNVSTSVNAKVVKGSESSVGGFSKATTDRSLKTG